MSSLLFPFIQVIELLLNLVQLLIILSFVINWFNADPKSPFVKLIRSLTEPMYAPIRRYVTGRFSLPLDLSPLIIIFIVIFIQKIIQFQTLSALR
ncbi:MAG: YggT family protein [Oligoflexales bacterium]|nr:YggT family protein [Oligoflexales bacterium]